MNLTFSRKDNPIRADPLRAKPQNIIVDLDNRLIQINWSDGCESVYDLTLLRRACPCAECRPWVHDVGKVGDTPEAVRRAVGEIKSVSDVRAVGAYAISFNWADGHVFGIYDFDLLRALGRCEQDQSTDNNEMKEP